MKLLKNKLTVRRGLIISIIFTLVCLIGANAVMTNFYKVDVTTTYTKTASSDTVSLRVYRPKEATSNNKAPAIVFAHGLSTTKESYTQYAIELSRRGYVVVTPDMLNHGGSDITSFETFFTDPTSDGYGVYSAVKYMANLDYVDTDQIGIAGHSMGGNATNMSIMLDNMSNEPLIDAVYLVSSNPTFKDNKDNWTNIYGDRSVGLFYSTYDHVYFSSVDDNGIPVSAQDFMNSSEAKSFVNFGKNPSILQSEKVLSGHTYSNEVNGKQAIRRIIQEDVIHSYAQGGDKAISSLVGFFQDTFEAPKYKVESSLIGNIYQVLSFLGLIGSLTIGVFVVAVLTKLDFFKELAAQKDKKLRKAPNKQGKVWFWALTIINCIFAFISISLIFSNGLGYFVIPQLPQQVSNIFALWSLANGIFILITSFSSYFLYGRKQGDSLKEWGVIISFKKLLKSILLSIISIASILSVVYIAAYVFQMDLRVYLWGIRDIPLDHLYLVLTYVPFYLLFGIAVSIAINSAYYSKIGKEPTWVNDLFFAFMNFIPAFVITVVGYYLFMKTGVQPNIFGSTFTFTYMINAIPVFPVAVILLRRIYKYCNNPYIPGIIVGVLLAFFQVASVFTCHTFMFM